MRSWSKEAFENRVITEVTHGNSDVLDYDYLEGTVGMKVLRKEC